MTPGKHDCPQCGQDMRLPPDAYQQLAELEEKVLKLERWVELHNGPSTAFSRVKENTCPGPKKASPPPPRPRARR